MSQHLYNKNALRKAWKGDYYSNTFPKTSSGTTTLAASDTPDRNVIIVIEVLEAFADGTGGQPTFAFGETSTTTKFSVTGLLTGAAVGAKFVLAGKLTGTKALLLTSVAATGTGTGKIKVNYGVYPSTL
jgi:hypothetical protein